MNDDNPLIFIADRFANVVFQPLTEATSVETKNKINNDDSKEKNTYLDFKAGDLVKIRDWKDMERQYGVDDFGDIRVRYTFSRSMKRFCNQQFIVLGKHWNNSFSLKPLNNKKNGDIDEYSISSDMLEIIEEGYVDKMKVKREELKKDKKDIDESIIKEMISKVDLAKVKRILAGSYNIPLTQLKGVDELVEQWANAKAEMYVLLGNNLKVEKEIEFEMNTSMMRDKLVELCTKYPAFYYIYSNLSTTELSTDTYKGSCSCLHSYCNNVQHNMKLTRFFSAVMNNKEFDIDISKVYENRKCKETICISIDPVDFLLMSINKSGWESCHKLHDMSSNGRSWGCYSAGTISYMVDETTIITYKHSDKIYDYQINKCKIKEYSKNWRQIIYYDKITHAFITSREYPYSSEEISSEIRNWFEEIIANKFEFENKWITAKNVGEDYCNNKTYLHYNDVLNDRENILCRPASVSKETIGIYVGGDPVCPICGEDIIEEENHPMCEDCYEEICC